MPAKDNAIVLIHGYSDKGESSIKWRDELKNRGYKADKINVVNYWTLTNEITIKDIAEGFDRALKIRPGLANDEPFDAIVHSTGMLVIRAWLATYARNRKRLKHLIGLAPATFGSPMAHKGRGWLGAIFKGGKDFGPDFMEAGDQVLSNLELGSSFTWDLAHQDLITDEPFYGPDHQTPYPFIFIGLKDYGWLKRTVTEPGTDGTVRWAGAGFNSRKIIVDLTVDPAKLQRNDFGPWSNVEVPFVFLKDLNHGTILADPSKELVDMVDEALQVDNEAAYKVWPKDYTGENESNRKSATAYQQFVVHAIDERGDGISDYYVELFQEVDGAEKILEGFDIDVHPFTEDKSFRCFHVDLSKLQPKKLENLKLRIIASSGTQLVGYHGFDSEKMDKDLRVFKEEGKWDAIINMTSLLKDTKVKFFWPFTTTLVELKMDREPMPLVGQNKVTTFLDIGS